jgi:drug/metabolite transporter (DMT)-like permease
MFQILLLYALCAISFTLCKCVLLYAKPLFFVGVRMVVAGICLLAYCSFAGEKWRSFTKREWGLLTQVTLFHIFCAYVFDLWALQYLTSAESSFFYNASPFIAALFSYWWFNERMTSTKWLGLVIGCVGFIQELLQIGEGCRMVSPLGLLPHLAMLVAVSSGVYGWIVVRALVKEGHSPLLINGIGMVGGGLLALGTSYSFEGWHEQPVTQWLPFIAYTGAIIIIINFIFYNLYGFLLKRYSATLLSFAGALTPFFVAVFGALFLRESLSLHFFGALLVVCVGLYLFYKEELKQGYILA